MAVQQPQTSAARHDDPAASAAPRGKLAWLVDTMRDGFLDLSLGYRVVVAALLAASLLALPTLIWFSTRPEVPMPVARTNAAEIYQALDRQDVAEAQRLANLLLGQRDTQEGDRGAALLALGLASARRAQKSQSQRPQPRFAETVERLRGARQAGLPPKRDAEAILVLAKCLSKDGRFAESRQVLEQGIKRHPRRASEMRRRLVEVCLGDPTPDLPAALAVVNAYLDDESLSPNERDAGLLLQVEILLRQRDLAACGAALDRFGNDDGARPEIVLLRARLLLEEGRQSRETEHAAEPGEIAKPIEEAITLLRRVQAAVPAADSRAAESMYLIGLCFLALQDYPAAANQFERTYRRYADSAAGWAAMVQTADLQRRVHNDLAAIRAYAAAITLTRSWNESATPWISVDEVRRRVLAAYEAYRDEVQFEMAAAALKAATPLLEDATQLQLEAELARAWGRQLLSDAGRAAPADAALLRRAGWAKLRGAGALFGDLAQARFASRDYPADCYASAECYLEGHDYAAAVAALREYVHRSSRSEHPRALLALGRALLALGHDDEAIRVLEQCLVDHADSPLTFEARLVCSQAYVDSGDSQLAEACLLDNLNNDLLTPESKEWRASLFALGRLLHLEARYPEALQRLAEAVERYPDAAEAVEARYLIADAHLQTAALAARQLETEQVEEGRRQLAEARRQSLEGASVAYDQVRELLEKRESQRELTAAERLMQRNCYFNRGAALVALGEYRAAIELLAVAVSRYQGSPEALAAYTEMAQCFRRLQERQEAQGLLTLARLVLERSSPEAQFTPATCFDRADWASYLNWLTTF